jgi:hypothetical protein
MDIFKFPFPVEIWGTVSDWIMIIVTTITSYFLYNTLKSQKEVQQAQNKLLEIEQIRLREDFRPNLKYSRFTENVRIDKPNKDVVSIAVRNISQSIAMNVKPIYFPDDNVEPIVFKPNPRTLVQNEKYLSLHFLVNSSIGEYLNCIIKFSIEYEDIAGTKYIQTVFLDLFEGTEEFRTFDPKLLVT